MPWSPTKRSRSCAHSKATARPCRLQSRRDRASVTAARLLKLNHSCLLDEGVTGLLASLIMGERECLGGSDPKPPACLAVVPFEGTHAHIANPDCQRPASHHGTARPPPEFPAFVERDVVAELLDLLADPVPSPCLHRRVRSRQDGRPT